MAAIRFFGKLSVATINGEITGTGSANETHGCRSGLSTRFALTRCEWYCQLLMGNVKTKAKAAVMRQEAVEMNRKGLSNEAIAAALGVSPRSIVRYLNTFLDSSDSRFPSNITEQDVAMLRAQERDHIEVLQRELLQRVAELDGELPIKAIEALAKAGEAFCKLSDRKSRLLGLDAPTDKPWATVNNTLNSITVGPNEMKILTDLARFRELQNGHGRSKLPATEI
jgi:hypothetical protein